jgi:hypothetical protein
MVTSGTFSPTLDKPIAMAYVRRKQRRGPRNWPWTSAVAGSPQRRRVAVYRPAVSGNLSSRNNRESIVNARTTVVQRDARVGPVSDEGGVKVATVGISAFAVEQLTDLVYMELLPVGKHVSVGRGVRRGRIGQGRQPALQSRGRRGHRSQSRPARPAGDAQPGSLRFRLDHQSPADGRNDLSKLMDYAVRTRSSVPKKG